MKRSMSIESFTREDINKNLMSASLGSTPEIDRLRTLSKKSGVSKADLITEMKKCWSSQMMDAFVQLCINEGCKPRNGSTVSKWLRVMRMKTRDMALLQIFESMIKLSDEKSVLEHVRAFPEPISSMPLPIRKPDEEFKEWKKRVSIAMCNNFPNVMTASLDVPPSSVPQVHTAVEDEQKEDGGGLTIERVIQGMDWHGPGLVEFAKDPSLGIENPTSYKRRAALECKVLEHIKERRMTLEAVVQKCKELEVIFKRDYEDVADLVYA